MEPGHQVERLSDPKAFDIKPLATTIGSGGGNSLNIPVSHTNAQALAVPKPLDGVPIQQNFLFQYHPPHNEDHNRHSSTSPLPEYHENEDDMSGGRDYTGEEDEGGGGMGGHAGILMEDRDGKSKPKFMGKCKVCGDDASGMYFGALVCVPCKTFFLRYYGDNFSFVCRNQKNCEINVKSRTQCKYCRMQKCLQVGMLRRVRPSHVQISEGQQLCVVCSDLANGLHFGAITCEGCKKFFRRGLKEHPTYVCKNDKDCVINPRTRNACRYCRYQKCLNAGMCREAIQMGRPSKFRGHTNVFDISMPFNKMSRQDGNDSSRLHQVASSACTSSPPNVSGSGLPYQANNASVTNESLSQIDPQNSQFLNIIGQVVKTITNVPGSAPSALSIPRPNIPFEVKSEPPDYDYHASPGDPYGYNSQTSPSGDGQILDLPDSILQMSTPWNMVKTMNQQMNCAVSNFLTSNQNELVDQIAQNLKYSTAGTVVTETSTSLTTMPSVCESRPSNTNNMTTLSSVTSTQALLYGRQHSVPSPEELDIMANLQKALGVFDDPNLVIRENRHEQQSNQMSNTHHSVPVINSDGRTMAVTTMASKYEQGGGTTQPQLRNSSMDEYSNVGMQPNPQEQQQQSPYSNKSDPSPPGSGPKKVPLEEIIQKELLDEEKLPCGVQEDSLAKFNEFMKKSHQQLSQWIDYLKKGSNKTISPNNTTMRVIMQTNNQEFDPNYWMTPSLPDENILFSDEHRKILEQITEAYSVFVEDGHKINIQLTKEFQDWLHKSGYTSAEEITDSEFPDAFNKRVVELYTVCSVAYCKKLPGFSKFDPTDQYNIVRLGQSQSRILAAACHWYNRNSKDFDYFLSWKPKNALREHKFKDSCLKYAEMIAHRDWDAVESALTNVLIMIATDYPELKHPGVIDNTRMSILKSFRAYTTAKYGTPNKRIEEQFSYIPKLRELGLLHYKWTMVTVLEQETSGDGQGLQEDVLL